MLDTLLQIGKTFREAKRLKHHRYIKPAPLPEPKGKTVIKYLSLPVREDFTFISKLMTCGACEAVAPFLERLVLVGGWAFRVLMNLPNNEPTNNRIPFTKDADFAVQLSVKSDFEDIRAHLLKSGFQNR